MTPKQGKQGGIWWEMESESLFGVGVGLTTESRVVVLRASCILYSPWELWTECLGPKPESILISVGGSLVKSFHSVIRIDPVEASYPLVKQDSVAE